MKPLLLILCASLSLQAFAGDKAGNGSDSVEPLFIKAKDDATKLVQAIRPDTIDLLQINMAHKIWLRIDNHLSSLQFYIAKMELAFQDPPCNEGGAPRGTSFDDTDPDHPKMCVSYSYNRQTTPEQAQAMTVHEAGHFTKTMDHVFLSDLGVKLVSSATQQSDVKEPFYKTYRYNAKHESCVAGFKNVEMLAKMDCQNRGYKKCNLQSKGVLGMTHKSDPEWPYECENYALVQGWNPKDESPGPLEAKSGIYSFNCDKHAKALSNIFGNLSKDSIGLYARCIDNQEEPNYKDSVSHLIVGVRPLGGKGIYTTASVCYEDLESCEKDAHQEGAGVSNGNFNIGLSCRAAVGEEKSSCPGKFGFWNTGYFLTGKVTIF